MPQSLEEAFQIYESNFACYKHVRDMLSLSAQRDYWLRKINYPGLNNKYRQQDVDVYMDRYFEKVNDGGIISLVSAFESRSFKLLQQASGQLKIFSQGYTDKEYRSYISGLVKKEEDVYSLSGIRDVLEAGCDTTQLETLASIISHRNFICHGGRGLANMKRSNLSVKEMYEFLVELIGQIKSDGLVK